MSEKEQQQLIDVSLMPNLGVEHRYKTTTNNVESLSRSGSGRLYGHGYVDMEVVVPVLFIILSFLEVLQ